jgi:hypothetical protein
MRLAFIFVLVGYGTKVGLAPVHTWLPEPVRHLLTGKTHAYADRAANSCRRASSPSRRQAAAYHPNEPCL